MIQKKKTTAQERDVDAQLLLANERTLLAWIRTSLTIVAGGIALAFISTNMTFGTLIGIGAIAFGGLLALVGYSRYRHADTAIRNDRLPTAGAGAIIVVVLGVVLFTGALVVIRSMHA